MAVQLRLSPEQAEALDVWRREQPDLPSRSEAIRRLVEDGLRLRKILDRLDMAADMNRTKLLETLRASGYLPRE